MWRKVFLLNRISSFGSSVPSTSSLAVIPQTPSSRIDLWDIANCSLVIESNKLQPCDIKLPASNLRDDLKTEVITDDIEALPKAISRREAYIHDDEVKQARSSGIGIVGQTAETLVVDRIRHSSSSRKSLHELRVSLFNMHSTRLAERLVKHDVGSLCLIEASQNNARLVKEFARKLRKLKKINVEAYRATLESLFPSVKTRSKSNLPVKLLFGEKTLCKDAVNPHILRSQRDSSDESGRNNSGAPVMVGILPTPTQQTSMLDSLLSSLIIHLCNYSTNTMFQYGPVELITFLSASNYAFLLCGTDHRFYFLSNPVKHQSWLFNHLFEVCDLRCLKGFSRSAFSPQIPLQKAISHEKKLAELNVKNGYLYAVSISPRREIKIGSLNLVTNAEVTSVDADSKLVEPVEVLLNYSFWISVISKLTAKASLLDKLRQWFPNSESRLSSLISSSTKVSDLRPEDFDGLFCAVYEELATNCVLTREMQKHFADFKVGLGDRKFAD